MMPDYRECYRGGVGESDEDTERVGLSLSVSGDSRSVRELIGNQTGCEKN